MKINFKNKVNWHREIGCGTFLFIIMTAALAQCQGTVVSVTGPTAPPNPASGFDAELAVGTSLAGVSWLSQTAFSNVTISVDLQGNPGAAGMAFLMTKIGSGTTTANQYAESSFAFPTASSLTPVFSGLHLGVGQYFLIIQQTTNGTTGNGAWLGSSSPMVTSAAAVYATGEYSYSGSIPGYAPDSPFGRGLTTYYDYTVASVPEPSAVGLIPLGGAVITWRWRRNRIHCEKC